MALWKYEVYTQKSKQQRNIVIFILVLKLDVLVCG